MGNSLLDKLFDVIGYIHYWLRKSPQPPKGEKK